MITDFADFHPRLSALIIVLLFTLIPGGFMLLTGLLFGDAVNTAKILFFYALAIQLILSFKVERPILVMLPFVMMLGGFVVCEIVYTISLSMARPGAGPSAAAYFFSSAIITLFGSEITGVIAGLLIGGLISLVRMFRE